MTRKEELEARAAQWLRHHGDQRLTRPLAALLEQVEREVLERVDRCIDAADHMGDVRGTIYSQLEELT